MNMKQDFLLFGAAYYDEYMPYDRIDKDMELLKEAGMNVIRIAESTWSTWEPEDGVFREGVQGCVRLRVSLRHHGLREHPCAGCQGAGDGGDALQEASLR